MTLFRRLKKLNGIKSPPKSLSQKKDWCTPPFGAENQSFFTVNHFNSFGISIFISVFFPSFSETFLNRTC